MKAYWIDINCFMVSVDGIFVTGFWKTDHIITFDIIDNSVYLRHSKWYYWMNTCLKQSQIT